MPTWTSCAQVDDNLLLFNDEFDDKVLNLFDKLLNAVYDIRYNFLSKTVRDVQGKTPDSSKQLDLRAVERFSILGAGAGWANALLGRGGPSGAILAASWPKASA